MRGFVTGVGSHTKGRPAADPTLVYEGHDLAVKAQHLAAVERDRVAALVACIS